MPRQDAQGRWISDDGLSYWDGAAWRPLGAQPAPTPALSPMPAPAPMMQPAGVAPAYGAPAPARRSPWVGILIGCGFALLLILVLGITCTVFVFNNKDFQRSFCSGYTGNNPNLTCPFNVAPASP